MFDTMIDNSRSSRRGRRIALLVGAVPLAGALLAGLTAPVLAQQERQLNPRQATRPVFTPGEADAVIARRVEISAGKSVVVDLPRDAKEVFVSNPQVANAVIRTARKVYLLAVSAGASTIIASDAEGRQIAALEVVVGREIDTLRQLLKAALPSSKVEVKPVADTIILSGEVDSPLEAQKAVDIAKGFVGASVVGTAVVEGKVINSLIIRSKDQVMLKVTVSEINRTVLKQLGVNINGTWQVAGQRFTFNNENPFSINGALNPGQIAAGQVGSLGTLPEGLRTLGNTGSLRNVDLKAFERQGVMRTLAEPVIAAVSGETAKFTAGGEVPVLAGSNCVQTAANLAPVCTQTYQYRPYGVQLVFTPVVLAEGRISIRVSTDVTDIDTERSFNTALGNVPAFRVRKQDTTVELPSGGSLVTAGLIQNTSRQAINGLPGLMNIPILGSLFRSRDYQRQETELMMIVTPYIARPVAPSALARPDDGFIDASDPASNLMGRLNRIYGVAGNQRPHQPYRGRVGFIHE
jgi:pilus assembly protein CpaC